MQWCLRYYSGGEQCTSFREQEHSTSTAHSFFFVIPDFYENSHFILKHLCINIEWVTLSGTYPKAAAYASLDMQENPAKANNIRIALLRFLFSMAIYAALQCKPDFQRLKENLDR